MESLTLNGDHSTYSVNRNSLQFFHTKNQSQFLKSNTAPRRRKGFLKTHEINSVTFE